MDPDKIRSMLPKLEAMFEAEYWPELNAAGKKFFARYHLDYREKVSGLKQGLQRFPWKHGELVVYHWLLADSRGTVFLVHGYFDHSGLYGSAVRFWLSQGYSVVAFDLPGHGLSSGNRACIESFDYYSEAFASLVMSLKGLPKPFIAMGQSTGGSVIMNAMLDKKFKIPQRFFVIKFLLAPLIRSRGWPLMKWLHLFLSPFVKSIPRKFIDNCDNQKFLDFLKKDPLQARRISTVWVGAMKAWIKKCRRMKPGDHKFYIVQGDNDITVDTAYNSKEIMRICPRSRVHTIEGMNHHIVNESPKFRKQVFAYLKECLPMRQDF